MAANFPNCYGSGPVLDLNRGSEDLIVTSGAVENKKLYFGF